MTWRSEGWKNPHRKVESQQWSGLDTDIPAPYPLLVITYDLKEYRMYEAGAEAMLSALKKRGEHVDASKAQYGYLMNSEDKAIPIGTYTKDFKGWFVLIPDDKEGV